MPLWPNVEMERAGSSPLARGLEALAPGVGIACVTEVDTEVWESEGITTRCMWGSGSTSCLRQGTLTCFVSLTFSFSFSFPFSFSFSFSFPLSFSFFGNNNGELTVCKVLSGSSFPPSVKEICQWGEKYKLRGLKTEPVSHLSGHSWR